MCPNAVVGDTDEGGKHPGSIPGVARFRAEETEGESCEFDRLGGCGGRTGCVSGFVSSLRIKRYDFLKILLISGI